MICETDRLESFLVTVENVFSQVLSTESRPNSVFGGG